MACVRLTVDQRVAENERYARAVARAGKRRRRRRVAKNQLELPFDDEEKK